MRKVQYLIHYNCDENKGRFYGPFVGRKAVAGFLKKRGFRKLSSEEGWGLTSRHYYRDEDRVMAEIVRLLKPVSIPRVKRRVINN